TVRSWRGVHVMFARGARSSRGFSSVAATHSMHTTTISRARDSSSSSATQPGTVCRSRPATTRSRSITVAPPERSSVGCGGEREGRKMGQERVFALLPWIVFSVVDRYNGQGTTWAAIGAVVTAAIILIVERDNGSGIPNVLMIGAVVWFSGLALAGA